MVEIIFPHTVRTLTPAEAFTVMVTAQIEREDGPAEVGYDIPVGISGEAMARLALDHYDVLGRAWELWREQRREILHDRRAAGVAGERQAV